MRPLLLLLVACGTGPKDADTGTDADGDGFGRAADCDDGDVRINPDGTELCNGVDDDCDGEIDEDDAFDAPQWFADGDSDGFGDPRAGTKSCAQPEGTVANGDDCDDADPDAHPDGVEICDPEDRDEDCDGSADDQDADVQGRATWYGDADGDGYGRDQVTNEACDPPDGFAAQAGDCLDTDPSTYPGADDVWYDGVDSDCGGEDDYDADQDGHASDAWGGDDCDDQVPGIRPSRDEVCGNGLDDDCDGTPLPCSPWGPLSEGDADARFTGAQNGAWTGAALAGVGDVDADGADDVLVGAPGYDSGTAGAGVVYLLPGNAPSDRIYLPATTLVGSTGEQALGTAVAGPGDVDGDGIPDLLVGAPGEASNGAGAGAAFLWLGPATVSIGLSAVDHALRGPAGAAAASALAGPGDVDGDGFADLLIGSTDDTAWLVSRPTSATADLDAVATARFTGAAGCGAGAVVAAAGDVDADGDPDLLIGGPDCAGTAGRAWLFLGPVTSDRALGDADGIVTGTVAGDALGAAASTAGDQDGDGLDDLVLGAPGASTAAGAALVFLGPATGAATASDAWLQLAGETAGDRLGSAVAGGADLQDDGHPDLLLGAPEADIDATGDGAAWLVAGPVSGALSIADAPGARFRGSAADAGLGASLDFVGDADGDGIDDLMVGAPGVNLGDGAVSRFLGGAW